MSIYQLSLIAMGLSGIIFGISSIYNRKLRTFVGLVGERTVFTGKSAILFGAIMLTTGIAVLFKGLEWQLLIDVSFLLIMAFYVFGFIFIVSLLAQLIQNRM